MKVVWSAKALADPNRLHAFLLPSSESAANNAVTSLIRTAESLAELPRIGRLADKLQPYEIRRTFVGKYEVRYGIYGQTERILRIWHIREDR